MNMFSLAESGSQPVTCPDNGIRKEKARKEWHEGLRFAARRHDEYEKKKKKTLEQCFARPRPKPMVKENLDRGRNRQCCTLENLPEQRAQPSESASPNQLQYLSKVHDCLK